MFNTFIDDIQNVFNLVVSDDQKNKFINYYDLLIEYNKITNLTRITDEQEVYYKHFFDSLTLINSINLNNIESICDMGAGAGFPSIPLKILFPHLKITIIDSLGKRIKFLEQLIETLELKQVKLIYDRIENYAQKNQNKFDLVTARALGSLPLILELGVPMVKVGHHFIAYKGSNYDEEIQESINAIQVLKVKLIQTMTFELPINMGFRAHIIFKKEKHLAGYPRSFAIMKKKPL